MKRHMKLLNLGTLLILLLGLAASPVSAQPALAAAPASRTGCDDGSPTCVELIEPYNYEGKYVGHDEPSLLFYSNTPGSGNNNTYILTLPKDPPTLPTQDGKGGTYNFQLHPAFWFGMAMCDSQSAPNPGMPCTPDSDSNIYDGANPAAADYIGKHPGAAFMEMQFYPPGWVPWPAGDSCDGTKWCAALNIDSLSENQNTGEFLNNTCADHVGVEYVNFAFITKNGQPQAPVNPVDATLATYTPDPAKDLFMNSGDKLRVSMYDTPQGFRVDISDLSTGESGTMTASAANSFGQVQFDPTGSSCNNIPYDFHPMYSTSSEHTRVPWAAHSYNVAFSDEIGHFEFCNTVDPSTGTCTGGGVSDPGGADPGTDDYACFSAADSTNVPISGCLGTDIDFDGVPYKQVWPGTFQNPGRDRTLHPTSVLFTSPTFAAQGGGSLRTDYSRVAFETDLPRIEFGVCDRTTGANCTNPPAGADFYPFFSTRNGGGAQCSWQLGGAYIPGTTNTFGGSSGTEFGPLLQLTYPSTGNVPIQRYNDFRQVLNSNPCKAGS